jgi:pyridoxal phosphate enzyme (YggS family)
MPVNKTAYQDIVKELSEKDVRLIAVSKIQSAEDIRKMYEMGQRDFGENYVRELTEKYELLPKDIHWHFIGHLQSNKVKYIAPFVHLIHGIDSFKLLKEVNKQALKNNRIIDCLLQVHIAQEETKFGFDENELQELFQNNELQTLENVRVVGLMGMASFSDNLNVVREEFKKLKELYNLMNAQYSMFNIQFSTLSMGMSGDYKVAIEEGSNMVRIGSLLFGARKKD